MNKEKYTKLELIIFSLFLFNSFTSTLILNTFKGMFTVEIIISILISFFLSLISLYIILDSNYLSITKSNNIIKIICIICAFIMILYSLSNSSIILKEVLLPNSNLFLIQITLLLTSLFLSMKGFKSILTSSNLFFYLYVFILIIIFFFASFNVKEINLLPLSFKINKLNFYEIFIFSLSPIFMIRIVDKDKISNNRFIYISYIIYIIFLLIKVLLILAVLGDKYMNIISYPEIEVLKIINIFNFFKNLEEVLVINIFLDNLVFLSITIYYIKSIINSIYNFNNKSFLFILLIILIIYNFNFIDIYPFEIILTIFISVNVLSISKKELKN